MQTGGRDRDPGRNGVSASTGNSRLLQAQVSLSREVGERRWEGGGCRDDDGGQKDGI